MTLKEAMKIVETYVYAKDFNRPHQMLSVFSHDATLEMEVNSDSISFPSLTIGQEQIADTLSRKFGATYDNVYTLCIEDTIDLSGSVLDCRWLVGMTHKEQKTCRVGYGSYRWLLSETSAPLVDELVIRIDDMFVFEEKYSSLIFNWLSQKNYPWCKRAELLDAMPVLQSLHKVKKWLTHPKMEKIAMLTDNARFSPE